MRHGFDATVFVLNSDAALGPHLEPLRTNLLFGVADEIAGAAHDIRLRPILRVIKAAGDCRAIRRIRRDLDQRGENFVIVLR